MASPAKGPRPITLAEYMAMPEEEGYRIEVSKGRLVREPGPGNPHGWLCVRIIHRLASYLDEHPEVGNLYAPVAYVLEELPLGVRIPDVSFVRGPRTWSGYASGLPHGAPDLAIEILSPSNRAAEMRRRIADLLEAGTLVVWVLDPRRKLATIHEASTPPRILRGADRLEHNELLPGFSWEVQQIFAD